MSVIVAKRKRSRLEYVSTSSDLLKYTIQRCLKLPKRLTFFITTKIVDTAHDIYKNVLYIEAVQISFVGYLKQFNYFDKYTRRVYEKFKTVCQ